jgi:hypothetical protein
LHVWDRLVDQRVLISIHPRPPNTQGPKEAAITVYERKLEEAEKATEAWKEARKEAKCVRLVFMYGIW